MFGASTYAVNHRRLHCIPWGQNQKTAATAASPFLRLVCVLVANELYDQTRGILSLLLHVALSDCEEEGREERERDTHTIKIVRKVQMQGIT